METAEKIYPALPSDQRLTPSAPASTHHRENKIKELEQELRSEVAKYEKPLKNYKKADKVCFGLTTFFTTAASTSSVAGTACLATGVGLVVAVPLFITASATSGCQIVTMWLSRRADLKVKKHTATLALAINAQRNLAKISSKLIDDGQITEQEFQLAMNIADQYYSQKKRLEKLR